MEPEQFNNEIINNKDDIENNDYENLEDNDGNENEDNEVYDNNEKEFNDEEGNFELNDNEIDQNNNNNLVNNQNQDNDLIKRKPFCRFPIAKIKNIIKMNQDIKLCNKNVYSYLGKAVELLFHDIAFKSSYVTKFNKRRTMNPEDICKQIFIKLRQCCT